jgi:hypothetical protein
MKALLLLLFLLATQAFAATSATLTWDASPAADKVISYVIYRKTGTTWTQIGTSTLPTYKVTAMDPGPNTFAVTAKSALAESQRSNEVTNGPDAPKNLTIITIEVAITEVK